jgi:hypothetical protein
MKRRGVFTCFLQAVVVGGIVMGATNYARGQQNATAAQQKAGREWLSLMDKNKDKLVDKKEFLYYMNVEFDKADHDHDGTLDIAELGKARTEIVGAANLAKGSVEARTAEWNAGKEWLVLIIKTASPSAVEAKGGKVSNDEVVDRKQFLDYMASEFDKADGDHDGTLDVTELGALRTKLAAGIKH